MILNKYDKFILKIKIIQNEKHNSKRIIMLRNWWSIIYGGAIK